MTPAINQIWWVHQPSDTMRMRVVKIHGEQILLVEEEPKYVWVRALFIADSALEMIGELEEPTTKTRINFEDEPTLKQHVEDDEHP